MGEGTAGEWDPPNRSPSLERSHLGEDAPLAQVCHQPVEAPQLEIATKDGSYALGFFFNHDDLAVLGGVSQGHDAANPQPLALGGSDLVPDALGGDLALELGKGQQD